MKIFINDIEYRLTNNAEILEQAGATAVMNATILLETQRIPEPFDSVTITDGGMSAGFNDFSSGIRDNTEVLDNVLSLKNEDGGTWAQLAGSTWNQWSGLTWNLLDFLTWNKWNNLTWEGIA